MKIGLTEIDGICLVGYRSSTTSKLKMGLRGSIVKDWPKKLEVNGVVFDLDSVDRKGEENHLGVGIVIREEANYVA